MHTVKQGVEAGELSPVLRQVAGLFRPGVDYPPREVDGYIDVLGSTDALDSRPSHQVFQKKLFPSIYEHFWRPVISRAFFGLFGMGARKERQVTLEMLSVKSGDRVLDVGCGPGNYTRYLAAANGGELAVGVDASSSMLAAGVKAEGGSNLAFVRADASALPFKDDEFDVVSCVGTVHMTKTPLGSLAEMTRVLAPGGRIVIVTTCAPSGAPAHVKKGVTVFARDEVPKTLAGSGLVDIDQRVVSRAQFVSARKPEA